MQTRGFCPHGGVDKGDVSIRESSVPPRNGGERFFFFVITTARVLFLLMPLRIVLFRAKTSVMFSM